MQALLFPPKGILRTRVRSTVNLGRRKRQTRTLHVCETDSQVRL